MHLFEVIPVDGATLSVFGGDFDEAVSLFMAWHIANRNTPLPDFEVRQRNPRWPGINTLHLMDALARNTAGIGQYDPGPGWTIVSPLDWRED